MTFVSHLSITKQSINVVTIDTYHLTLHTSDGPCCSVTVRVLSLTSGRQQLGHA